METTALLKIILKMLIEANNQYNGALYNAANSAYRNGDFEKATEYYKQYAGTLENKNDKAKAYHNLGNVFLKRFSGSSQNQNPEEQKKSSDYLKNSIEAYKNSLRNNPNDEDTRYNLSYALSKLNNNSNRKTKIKKKVKTKTKRKTRIKRKKTRTRKRTIKTEINRKRKKKEIRIKKKGKETKRIRKMRTKTRKEINQNLEIKTKEKKKK